MMHDRNCGFVIAVLNNGKVLREVNGTVFLPFNSEYTIRVKNPTGYRVGVVIDVDGTEITNGKVVIDPRDSIDLKRMLVNGDMYNGPALKFVPLSDGRVQDPTSSENGVIKVRFYKEVSIPKNYTYGSDYYRVKFSDVDNTVGTDPGFLRNLGSSAVRNAQTKGIVGQSIFGSSAETLCSSHDSFSGNIERRVTCSTAGQAGATVEGSNVSQQFKQVSMEFEPFACATLVLRMRGLEEPVFSKSKEKLYCTNCGGKIKITDNFCGKCGARNVHKSNLRC